MLAMLRFVSLMLGALNLGLAFAHVVEMAPKRAMSGPDWLTTQQAYRDFGRVAAVTFPTLLLAELATLGLVRERRPIALLTGLAAGATATTVAIWARFNQPVNREIGTWRADALPPNWAKRRDQWEYAHAASAACHAVSLAALTAAALWDERPAASDTRWSV